MGRSYATVDTLSFKSPKRARLSPVATIASSFEIGDQPRRRAAFSLVAFLRLPSSGRISLMAGFFRRQGGRSAIARDYPSALVEFFRGVENSWDGRH